MYIDDRDEVIGLAIILVLLILISGGICYVVTKDDYGRQGGWSSDQYELVDAEGTVYFADHYPLVCEDAKAKLKVCNANLAKNTYCRYNAKYKMGNSVDNIRCGKENKD